MPRLRTRGWREASAQSLWDAVEHFAPAGLRHVLCTDIERDGALEGPNVALYRRSATPLSATSSGKPPAASRSGADLTALAAAGVAAAISGKALLEQRISIEELRPFLPNA